MSLSYSPRLKDVINKSKLIAKENGRNIVNPIDLFLSCLNSGFDPIIYFISSETEGFSEFHDLCKEKCASLKKDSNKKLSWSKESIICIDNAYKEAEKSNASFIGVEHLFLHLIKRSSQVRNFLNYLGIDNKSFYEKFWIGPTKQESENHIKLPSKSQDDIESDLIESIENRVERTNFKFHGRTEELEKMMSILCRKKKSNVLLVGEPGVGKTALVEGLVRAMQKQPKDSKIAFIRMNIFELNLSNLLSDTIFRGQFEKKLNGVLESIKDVEPKAVLFIDEFHMAMKAGDNLEGSMNIVNILKPALADGSLSVIGATTYSEYKQYVEKDPALVRRFEIINVSEPSKEETFDIVWNSKSSYEEYHGFSYNKDLIKSIIDAADKYLPYKKFPDKAFEMLDEISSNEKLISCKKPQKLTLFEDWMIEMADKMDESEEFELDWDEYEAKLAQYKKDTEDYIKQVASNYSINKKAVDNYIKEKFSSSKINNGIVKKLNQRVYGQEKSIDEIYKSISIHNSISRKNKPINSILLAGNSGVGKNHLVENLSDLMGYDKYKLYLDMSRYSRPESIYSLTGQDKSSLNSHNSLFEFVKRTPSSFIIFDNIDLAHKSIIDLMCQILNNGKTTDNHGKEIDFSRTMIFGITSSVTRPSSLGFDCLLDEIIINESKVPKILHESFDDTIFMSDLSVEALIHIIKDIISNIELSIDIEIEDSVYGKIASINKKQEDGAKKLSIEIKKSFMSPLFDFIRENDKNLTKKSKIVAKVVDNSISFSII